MARKLNTKQKIMLRDLVDNEDVGSIDDFENGEFGELEALHDYETLYQDVNRFISDYRTSKLNA